MPKATFSKDFVWKAKRGVRIAYKAGATYGITSACYAQAQAAGALVQTRNVRPTYGHEASDDARG